MSSQRETKPHHNAVGEKFRAASAATVSSDAAFGVNASSATPPPSLEKISLKVNGNHQQLEVDTRTTLLDALREHFKLTGTKKGVTTVSVAPVRLSLMGDGSTLASPWRSCSTMLRSPPLKVWARLKSRILYRRRSSSMTAISVATAHPVRYVQRLRFLKKSKRAFPVTSRTIWFPRLKSLPMKYVSV